MLIFNVAKMIVSRDEYQLSVDPLNSLRGSTAFKGRSPFFCPLTL